jgi:hypothetical protein
VAIRSPPGNLGGVGGCIEGGARRTEASAKSTTPIGWDRPLLVPLAKHLPGGLAVGIEAITFTAFPSGFLFGLGDVPIRAEFLQNGSQVLPELFDGRPAKKPVTVVDLEYYGSGIGFIGWRLTSRARS